MLTKSTYSNESRFAGVSIRGRLHLEALKLYLLLLTFRRNESHKSLIAYDKIEGYSGIPRGRIRRAIDVLLASEWISVESVPAAMSKSKPPNTYILRGDFWGRNRRTYARAASHGFKTEREKGGFFDLE